MWDTESVIELIASILTKIQNLGVGALELANNTSPYVMDAVDNITQYAVKPFASVLLSLFAVMQLYKAVSYLNDIGAPQGGSARLEVLGMTLAKIGFVYWVIQRMSDLMWGLVDAGNWLMAKVQAQGSYNGIRDFDNITYSVRRVVEENSDFKTFFDIIGANMNIWVVNLIISICGVLIFILFFARVLQIYALVAISPIPLVTFIHEEHKQIGISFLKSFMAVLLQGSIMVLYIYLFSSVVSARFVELHDINGMVWSAAGFAILLVVCMATSGAVAKKIVNAM